MKKLALACTTVLILSGCSWFSSDSGEEGASMSGSSDVAAAIKEAEAAIAKAESVDGAWRDSRNKYIKAAKAAASKGDNETAMKMAKKAQFEGEMGYQQAMEQKNAKPWLF